MDPPVSIIPLRYVPHRQMYLARVVTIGWMPAARHIGRVLFRILLSARFSALSAGPRAFANLANVATASLPSLLSNSLYACYLLPLIALKELHLSHKYNISCGTCAASGNYSRRGTLMCAYQFNDTVRLRNERTNERPSKHRDLRC